MTQHERDPKSLLPLTSTTFSILLSLVSSDSHAYRLRQELDARQEGMMRAGVGTLYRAIDSLLEQELITKATNRPNPSDDDPRRIYYSITPFGRMVVEAEAQRMAELVQEAVEKGIRCNYKSHCDPDTGNTNSNDSGSDPSDQSFDQNRKKWLSTQPLDHYLQSKGALTLPLHTREHSMDRGSPINLLSKICN